MDMIKGERSGKGKRFAVVVAQFNTPITEELKKGAIETLLSCETREEDIDCFAVPGAFELPILCKQCALSGKYDAIIAIGAIIRGETYHFEVVANNAASGVMQGALSTGVPIIFSVLTTDTEELAWARSGKNGLNLGSEGALSALEMASVIKKVCD